jgi:hypothetical protein
MFNRVKLSLAFFGGLILSFMPLFFGISLASGDYSGQIGYICPPYTLSITEGAVVMFSGVQNCHYIGQNLPNTVWYGDIYSGTLGNSTIVSGHYLVSGTDFDSIQSEGYFLSEAFGANLFVAIFASSDGGGLTAWRNYFQSGGSPPSDRFGTINFKKGLSDFLNFTSPIGNYTQSPYYPTFTAQYTLSATSTWTALDVEVSFHQSTATSTTLTTQHVYSLLSSSPFSFSNTEFSSGCYTYRARFMQQQQHLPPAPVLPDLFSQYFENDNYAFCVGVTEVVNTDFCGKHDFGAFGNAICNVFAWLFIPKTETLQNFANLGATMSGKFPFGYFYSIKDAISNFNSTTSPAYNIYASTTPISTNVFDPIKNGLAWILWIVFAFWVVKRIGDFNF